ncbi:Retrovirus-related Pol polyprotein from transposon TNT 1-94 [Trichinella pseudospiralis]|uniref:Retrovirus-related Pol polyprotein from transposon TNT 1-94 n=1 Tax=Trichinella pseudospiralis TaxID=6337 RepID=A0A0V1HEM8_TRIPS|nr:Retrovirus-related Pol polyprotein from transposon TNT 1-94 [Trichinella pseudospiralis]
MFAEFLMRKGIRHERTIPETPQQNGVAERMNQTLVEKARTMLIDANLSPDLWAEAVGTANYLRNKCLTNKCESFWLFGNGARSLRAIKEVGSEIRRTDLRWASKEESTNSLMNPDVGEEAVIVWTSQDSDSTEMNPNPSVSPKAQVREQSDPISYEEAVNRPDAKEWLKAINEELASHRENQSWEPAVLPPHKKVIKSKWVFKTKYKEDGTIEKRKARLVARGYSQLQGIDYEGTFAPTLGYSSLRYLLSLAAKNNLEVDQMDVVTAFLNLSLNEEIYREASRAWYGELDDTLRSFGLNRLKKEPCIYFLRKNKIFLAVGVYVDDLLILSNNESAKNELKIALCKRFKIKDLGKAHWCLGIRIVQDVENGTQSIDQEQYIEEMLHRFKMSDCKGVKTPLDPNQVLSKAMMPRSDEETKQMHAVPYRVAVGCLVYLSQSCRPDICHTVGIYTETAKLVYRRTENALTVYSDSDWGNDRDDRRSISGCVVCHSGAAIAWTSKKHRTLRSLQSELEKESSKPTLLCDNSGAVSISTGQSSSARTRHIDIRYHFVKEKIQEGKIEMRQIPSADNAANMFTKALTPSRLAACVKLIGMAA